jgi:hypothetical protein
MSTVSAVSAVSAATVRTGYTAEDGLILDQQEAEAAE